MRVSTYPDCDNDLNLILIVKEFLKPHENWLRKDLNSVSLKKMVMPTDSNRSSIDRISNESETAIQIAQEII